MKTWGAVGRQTYQSAPESGRAGLAELPAAAEAKEVGAIVWWVGVCAEVAMRRKRGVEAKRFSVGIVAGEWSGQVQSR
jgi:hypothetical protein